MRTNSGPTRARRQIPLARAHHLPAKHRSYTHGLYADRLSPHEWEILEALDVEDVDHEIALTRAFVGRLAAILGANGLGPDDRASLSDVTQNSVKLMKIMLSELRYYLRMRIRDTRRLTDVAREIEEGKQLARSRRRIFTYLDQGDRDEGKDSQQETGDVER